MPSCVADGKRVVWPSWLLVVSEVASFVAKTSRTKSAPPICRPVMLTCTLESISGLSGCVLGSVAASPPSTTKCAAASAGPTSSCSPLCRQATISALGNFSKGICHVGKTLLEKKYDKRSVRALISSFKLRCLAAMLEKRAALSLLFSRRALQM